jgi:hypothetical protein
MYLWPLATEIKFMKDYKFIEDSIKRMENYTVSVIRLQIKSDSHCYVRYVGKLKRKLAPARPCVGNTPEGPSMQTC